MGIGDAIFDSITPMLEDIYHYDYADSYREEIIELVATKLRIVHQVDGFCNSTCKCQNEGINWNGEAKKFILEFLIEKKFEGL